MSPASSAGGNIASQLGGDAGDTGGDRALPVYRFPAVPRITGIGRLSKVLWVGRDGDDRLDYFRRAAHFNARQLLIFLRELYGFRDDFFHGLGGAMLMAAYDYWGYYNVCFLGDEIKEPGKNIPRALLLSIGRWHVYM